jgi:oligosaccharide translocation protein RFT1
LNLLKHHDHDSFTPQAAWKLVLAEGEKAALIAVAAADEVGVYGLVASLG